MSQTTALVTGVSRRQGIGWAVADRLAADGHQVVSVGWPGYDGRMPWGTDSSEKGPVSWPFHEVDFEDAAATEALIPRLNREHGPIGILVMCHCESVDSDIRSSTVESFDRHLAVNVRATWQLVKGFANQVDTVGPVRRILAMTSDVAAWNLPYGASKAAMDRVVLAAAHELADLSVTANVINPGATDTGWMTPEIADAVRSGNLQGRIGLPADAANLVSFLCSPQGQWINGQLLHSDGGRG